MNYEKSYADLKSLVYEIHMELQICEHPRFQKIKKGWPLAKGSVARDYSAWNVCAHKESTIQDLMAFIVKALFVLKNDCVKLEKNKILDFIFCNEFFNVIFWSDIRDLYSNIPQKKPGKNRFQFLNNDLKKNTPVFLCLEDTTFRTKYGTNNELVCFETFIEDLLSQNNGLIAFSTQKFLSDPTPNNRRVKTKLETDGRLISIEQALNPSVFVRQVEGIVDPVKTGCFDRLLEICAQGQDFIFTIQKEFLKYFRDLAVDNPPPIR